jgi:hypothetical protein
LKKLISLAAALAFLVPVASYAGDRNEAGALSQSGAQSSVNINGGKSYRSTGAAIAPGLAVGAYSCSGSTSAAAGGPGWGIAFGTTRMDGDCNHRENAKLADVAFGRQTARRVLCKIQDIADVEPSCQPRRALTTSGRPTKRLARTVQVTSNGNGWGQRSN